MAIKIVLHNQDVTRFEPLQKVLREEGIQPVVLADWASVKAECQKGQEPTMLVTGLKDEDELTQFCQSHQVAYVLYFSQMPLDAIILTKPKIFNAVNGILNYEVSNIGEFLFRKLVVNSNKNDQFYIDVFYGENDHLKTKILRVSSEKRGIISELEDDLFDQKVKAYQQGYIIDIFVELVDNAIYDAPVDGKNKKKYYDVDRTVDIQFDPGEEIRVKWIINDDFVMLSVTDNFGRLGKADIFSILKKCYERKDDVVDLSSGGGRIGFGKILNCASDLIINIEPTKQTEVVCVVDRKVHKKALRKNPRVVYYNLLNG